MNRIFKEGGELVFESTYLPEYLPHREEQLNNLIEILEDGIEGKHYSIPVLYGNTGTGKTSTVRKVLKEIENKYSEEGVKTIYINAATHRRAYTAIIRIANRIVPIPERGYGIDEIILKLYDRLDMEGLKLIVAIDDADELIRIETGKILEILTRIEESYPRRLIYPIIVVRKLEILNILPPHISSKLGGYRIEFPQYNKEQLGDILKERIERGIVENGITENAVKLSTYSTEKIFGGNARELLNMIYKAGKIAEANNDNKIYSEHIRMALFDSYLKSIKPHLAVEGISEKKYYEILWPLISILYKKNDVYEITRRDIENAYEVYKKMFKTQDDINTYVDYLEILAESETYILSYDNGKIIFFGYPVKILYERLSSII